MVSFMGIYISEDLNQKSIHLDMTNIFLKLHQNINRQNIRYN